MLALLIMVQHLLPNKIHGQLVVETFFVISGFYMALILDKKYKDDIFGFYKARYLKLWPGYFLVLVLSIIWSYKSYGIVGKPEMFEYFYSFAERKNFILHTDWYVQIWYWFVQITLIGIETVNFVNIDNNYHIHLTTQWHATDRIMPYFFAPIWAVGLELGLYLFAPFLWKYKKIAISLIIPSLIYKLFYLEYPMLSGLLPAEIGIFAIGMAGYIVYKKCENNMHILQHKFVGIIVYIVIVLISSYIFIQGLNGHRYIYPLWLVFVGILCPVMFGITKNLRWDNFLGKTSYYLYIGGIFGTWLLYIVGWKSTNTGTHQLILYDFFANTIALFISAVLCVIFLEPLLDRLRFGRNYKKYHLEFSKI